MVFRRNKPNAEPEFKCYAVIDKFSKLLDYTSSFHTIKHKLFHPTENDDGTKPLPLSTTNDRGDAARRTESNSQIPAYNSLALNGAMFSAHPSGRDSFPYHNDLRVHNIMKSIQSTAPFGNNMY